MKVTLISVTPEALELLLFTKETRLAQDPGLFNQIRNWPMERKLEQLAYMRGTIQSSWEFVDYIFLIEGVSRSFTHQLVRTRHASFAQQSQRTVDMTGFEVVEPHGLPGAPKDDEPWGEAWGVFHAAMGLADTAYQNLRALNMPPQVARAVLPEAIATNIIVKANLRTLSEMAKVRLCTRTQGEYQDVFRAMRETVITIHPWAEEFIEVACVATGVCCFPNYHECPIQGMTFNPGTGFRYDRAEFSGLPIPPATREEIKKEWQSVRFEATPVASR